MDTNDLLQAARVDTNSTGTTSKQKKTVHDYRSSPYENPAITNKAYRGSHEASKPQCTLKIITNSRIYGTRGSSGSTLAKSAIRLAIDTGVRTPCTFGSSSLRSLSRIKTIVLNDMSANDAVLSLNDFERRLGGKVTDEFWDKMTAYKRAKHDILSQISISTNSEGRPLFKNDAQQASYFEQMQQLSFAYYEVYLSVQPKGGRATRSKSFRAMSLEELGIYIPEFTFEIQ